MTKEGLIITGNDAKNFILKREKQIKDIDNKTTTNKKKRLKLINDYKSVQKLMEEKNMKKILIFIICTTFSVGVFSKENNVVNGVETVYDDTKGSIETIYNDTKSVVTTIYDDMKGVASEIYPDVKNALSEIARGLGIGVEYTWSVLVKQYVVIAIAELIKLILILAVIICGIVWLWKVVKNNTSITWKVIPGGLMLIIGLCMTGSIDFIEIIQGLVNPDFGAINYVLQFIKTL